MVAEFGEIPTLPKSALGRRSRRPYAKFVRRATTCTVAASLPRMPATRKHSGRSDSFPLKCVDLFVSIQ
jgi:hypothetical protein